MHKFKLFTCNVNACIYVWYESIQGTIFCGEKHHVLNEIVQTLYFNTPNSKATIMWKKDSRWKHFLIFRVINKMWEVTSARRRPIRLSDVVKRSMASDGDEVSTINLSSSSIRKFTLHSSSLLWRISHSCNSLALAAITFSVICFSLWTALWNTHKKQ